jgi:SAM-dependent methyltransferase
MGKTRKRIRDHNRSAWNHEVATGNQWTVPVSPEAVARAKHGEWELVLTPTIPVPKDWYPPVTGADVLCLASGGGQQSPILAAAGASVTVLDNSPAQLARDREVAEREGLELRTIEGDMADLSIFSDGSFDLVFHPVSNVFVPEVLPVWRECHRVLRPGGMLLAGFMNPDVYIFDYEKVERTGELEVKYPLPYADTTHLDAATLQKRYDKLEPLEWSHTLDEQIGGQIAAGFVITGFFEDRYSSLPEDPIPKYMATCIATRAVKPA